MSWQQACTILSGVLFVWAFVPYIKAILKGVAKPQKSTWIIWGVLDTIILIGMLAKGTINGQILAAVVCAWSVVILSIKHGEPGWKMIDKICLLGAAIGVALWIILRNPVVGIVINSAVLLIGSVPTFVSAWRDPSREDRTAWTIFWVSCIFVFLGITKWDLANVSQPAIFFTVETIMVYILYIHARSHNRIKA